MEGGDDEFSCLPISLDKECGEEMWHMRLNLDSDCGTSEPERSDEKRDLSAPLSDGKERVRRRVITTLGSGWDGFAARNGLAALRKIKCEAGGQPVNKHGEQELVDDALLCMIGIESSRFQRDGAKMRALDGRLQREADAGSSYVACEAAMSSLSASPGCAAAIGSEVNVLLRCFQRYCLALRLLQPNLAALRRIDRGCGRLCAQRLEAMLRRLVASNDIVDVLFRIRDEAFVAGDPVTFTCCGRLLGAAAKWYASRNRKANAHDRLSLHDSRLTSLRERLTKFISDAKAPPVDLSRRRRLMPTVDARSNALEAARRAVFVAAERRLRDAERATVEAEERSKTRDEAHQAEMRQKAESALRVKYDAKIAQAGRRERAAVWRKSRLERLQVARLAISELFQQDRRDWLRRHSPRSISAKEPEDRPTHSTAVPEEESAAVMSRRAGASRDSINSIEEDGGRCVQDSLADKVDLPSIGESAVKIVVDEAAQDNSTSATATDAVALSTGKVSNSFDHDVGGSVPGDKVPGVRSLNTTSQKQRVPNNLQMVDVQSQLASRKSETALSLHDPSWKKIEENSRHDQDRTTRDAAMAIMQSTESEVHHRSTSAETYTQVGNETRDIPAHDDKVTRHSAPQHDRDMADDRDSADTSAGWPYCVIAKFGLETAFLTEENTRRIFGSFDAHPSVEVDLRSAVDDGSEKVVEVVELRSVVSELENFVTNLRGNDSRANFIGRWSEKAQAQRDALRQLFESDRRRLAVVDKCLASNLIACRGRTAKNCLLPVAVFRYEVAFALRALFDYLVFIVRDHWKRFLASLRVEPVSKFVTKCECFFQALSERCFLDDESARIRSLTDSLRDKARQLGPSDDPKQFADSLHLADARRDFAKTASALRSALSYKTLSPAARHDSNAVEFLARLNYFDSVLLRLDTPARS